MPANAPTKYKERGILWNAVEQNEKSKSAQLAREVEIALPVELSQTEQIDLVREFVQENFSDKGMCADIAIHDKHSQKHENPHAHIMLTMRPINEHERWEAKSKKEYILDSDGNKQYDPVKRSYKCRKIRTTNWDSTEFLQNYRQSWADKVNKKLENNGIIVKLTPLSYKKQGLDQKPTIHLGYKAHALEKKGVLTDRGNQNREIQKLNEIKRDTLEKIFSSGTKQEALEYIASIRDQYIFQTNLKSEIKSKKENTTKNMLPDAQKSLLSISNDLSRIEGLVIQRTQIRANKAELKWWRVMQINTLTNKSLELKDKITIETQKFTNKWGIVLDKAADKIEKLEQTIRIMEQNLEKFPDMNTKTSQEIKKLQEQFRKDWLLVMAKYDLYQAIKELPPIPRSAEKRSVEHRISEIKAMNELNKFTYDEIKDSYTMEQQKKLDKFFKKAQKSEESEKEQDKNKGYER